MKAGEHDAPGGEGRTIGGKAGKSRGDGVGVDKLGDAQRVSKHGTRDGGLTRAAGAADDDDGWGLDCGQSLPEVRIGWYRFIGMPPEREQPHARPSSSPRHAAAIGAPRSVNRPPSAA